MANTALTLHATGETLNNRYRILNPIGRGGLGLTYAANDLQTNQLVALKVLSLQRAADWKKLELFEREAQVLAQLNHPGIPRYLDYFQVDSDQDRCFYIAQQLAPGRSLDQWIQAGWKPDPETVERLATQVLEILIYLQTLLSPVFHRDIKPQNIIRNENGKLFLVDFGSVQNTYRQQVIQGSTVVGTFGYMAPEQFRGEAQAGTDLYGLGATLLFLLTGESPAKLPQSQLKIQFRQALLDLDPFFADWLDGLLDPRLNARFAHAQEALDSLFRRLIVAPPPLLRSTPQPLGSPIQLSKSKATLSIQIPAVGMRTPQVQRFAIANLIWNGFLGFVVAMIVSLQLFLAPVKFLSFSILVMLGLFLLVKYAYAALTVTQVELRGDRQTLQLCKVLLGSTYQKRQFSYSPADAERLQVKTRWWWPWRRTPVTYLSIRGHKKRCSFGDFLTPQESHWLAQEIRAWMGSYHG